jgi:hypothetical protein
MIYNQKITQALSNPLRKHLLIGATSVVAAGALLGVGVAGASASTVQPTPVTTHSAASVHSHHETGSLIEQLRTDLFQGQINGSQAQALAARILGNPAITSAIPANLTSDLTALRDAPAANAVTKAEHIKSTALSGGYGAQLQKLATDLQVSAKYPISKKLAGEISTDISTNASLGAKGARIAATVASDPRFFSKLPAQLQSDVTALKNAPASDTAEHVLGIETAAATGGYGQQIQTVAQHLLSLSAASSK